MRWAVRCLATTGVLIGVGAPAAPAAQLTRAEATEFALKALDVRGRSGPEIVFAGRSPVEAGTRIREAGAKAFTGKLSLDLQVRRSTAPEVFKVPTRSWVFYNDRAPRQGSTRPGRIVLVDARTGGTRLTRMLNWLPVIGGSFPPYLRSPAAYEDSQYQVFTRGVRQQAVRQQSATDLFLPPETAAALGRGGTCLLKLGDVLSTDSALASDGVGRTANVVDRFFGSLAGADRRVATSSYRDTRLEPAAWARDASKNCRDVFLWIAGATPNDTATVTLGLRASGDSVSHVDLRPSDLADALGQRSSTRFVVLLDVRGASQFYRTLERPDNVSVVRPPPGLEPGSRQASAPYTLRLTQRLIDGLTTLTPSVFKGISQARGCSSQLAVVVNRAVAPQSCPAPTAAPVPTPSPEPTPPPPTGPVLQSDLTDVALAMSVSQTTPKKSETVQITLSVLNTSDRPASGVRVRVRFPAALQPTGFSAGVGAISGQQAIWDVGDVGSGAVRIATLAAVAVSPTPGPIVSEITATNQTDKDSVPDNDEPSEDDRSSVAITPVAARLTVLAYPDSGGAPFGAEQTRTGQITVQNTGAIAAENVVVEIRPSAAYTASSISAIDGSVTNNRWTIVQIAPGATVRATFSATAGVVIGSAPLVVEVVESGSFDNLSTPGNAADADEIDDFRIPFVIVP